MEENKSTKRYCFRTDEDSHWYCIPIEKSKLFYELLEIGDDDSYKTFDGVFGKMRIDGYHIYSFTDPKRDK